VTAGGAVSGGADGCPEVVVNQPPRTYLLRVVATTAPIAAADELDVTF